MKLKEKINEYLLTLGYSREDLDCMDTSSVYLAEKIAIYAHRNQTRLDGKAYISHPYSVLDKYRDFVGLTTDDYFCIDVELMYDCGIPFRGVQEVCLLHDVIEDSDITLNEIAEIYTDCSLGKHFDCYIRKPLSLVTHDKTEDYFVYVEKMIEDPVACIVKFMDLADNMNPTSLSCFGKEEFERIQKYTCCALMINEYWHFLENIQKYHLERENQNE